MALLQGNDYCLVECRAKGICKRAASTSGMWCAPDKRVHMVRYVAPPEMLLGGLAHMISGELHEVGKMDSYHMSITLSSPVSMSYAILITFVSCSCTFPELLLCAKS